MNPVLAAVFSGTALFLLVDEGLTPTLGLSAPNNQYPLSTHLRGFLGHLAIAPVSALRPRRCWPIETEPAAPCRRLEKPNLGVRPAPSAAGGNQGTNAGMAFWPGGLRAAW